MRKYNIAVVGATGMVGRKFLQVLEERNLPVGEYFLMASARSAGKEVEFMGKKYTVEELNKDSFGPWTADLQGNSGGQKGGPQGNSGGQKGGPRVDIALFSAGAGTSLKYAPIAAAAGTLVIDNSSAWRMNPEIPLVVPEVNPQDIAWNKGIIANPNCSTIQAVVALKPLHDLYDIKRVVYSTYQAVSGAGMGGYSDLENGISGDKPKKFPHPIFGNVIPHIDVFEESGYTKEEIKMVKETQKILGDEGIRVTATTVRVPVFHGHSESINIEFNKPYDLDELKAALKAAPGIIVMDDPSKNEYPMPVYLAGRDEVFVGRIRRDDTVESGVNIWVVADNLRKGAATNAVQIAQEWIRVQESK